VRGRTVGATPAKISEMAALTRASLTWRGGGGDIIRRHDN
jgi:hypothetical protein